MGLYSHVIAWPSVCVTLLAETEPPLMALEKKKQKQINGKEKG